MFLAPSFPHRLSCVSNLFSRNYLKGGSMFLAHTKISSRKLLLRNLRMLVSVISNHSLRSSHVFDMCLSVHLCSTNLCVLDANECKGLLMHVELMHMPLNDPAICALDMKENKLSSNLLSKFPQVIECKIK